MSQKREGDLLAEYRKARNLTQAELGQMMGGKSEDWILNREHGRTKIRAKERARFATILGVPESALVPPVQPSMDTPAMLPNLGNLTATSGRIKVYGAVSAGDGNVGSFDPTQIEVPQEFARPDFGALVIEGDSMMDFLHPSDIVIFRDWKQEKLNHIMAAKLPDGEWVVKKLVYESGMFKLRSLNSEGNPDILPPFELAGFLVGFVRDDGPERLIRLNPYGLKP